MKEIVKKLVELMETCIFADIGEAEWFAQNITNVSDMAYMAMVEFALTDGECKDCGLGDLGNLEMLWKSDYAIGIKAEPTIICKKYWGYSRYKIKLDVTYPD